MVGSERALWGEGFVVEGHLGETDEKIGGSSSSIIRRIINSYICMYIL